MVKKNFLAYAIALMAVMIVLPVRAQEPLGLGPNFSLRQKRGWMWDLFVAILGPIKEQIKSCQQAIVLNPHYVHGRAFGFNLVYGALDYQLDVIGRLSQLFSNSGR